MHAIFGSFLVGMIMPRDGKFTLHMCEKIDDLVSNIFLPLYFALSGTEHWECGREDGREGRGKADKAARGHASSLCPLGSSPARSPPPSPSPPSGLKTDVGSISHAIGGAMLLLVILVATAGKFIGCAGTPPSLAVDLLACSRRSPGPCLRAQTSLHSHPVLGRDAFPPHPHFQRVPRPSYLEGHLPRPCLSIHKEHPSA